MSDYCSICQEFKLFPDSHTCPPRWRVVAEEYDEYEGESERFVYARSAEQAAEKRAEQIDEGGTPVVLNGHGIVVRVTGQDGVERRYHVEAELVPDYSASLLA